MQLGHLGWQSKWARVPHEASRLAEVAHVVRRGDDDLGPCMAFRAKALGAVASVPRTGFRDQLQ